MLTTKVIALIITTRCSLRCKKCALGIPYFDDQKHDDLDMILNELDSIFKIYDYVERIDISGGEPLLHPDILEIVKHCSQHQIKFGSVRLITNGTILPKAELLETMQSLGSAYGFLLDDYGKWSPKMGEIKAMLDDKGIPYKVNLYHGAEQYCGGWIDFGGFEHRGYSETELLNVFRRCHTSENPCITLFQGEAYFCVRSMLGYKFGHYKLSKSERIDLRSITKNLSVAQKTAEGFGKLPPAGCMYCNGFDTENSARFPAAEQL